MRSLQLAWSRIVRELEEARLSLFWPVTPVFHQREYHILQLWASQMNSEPAAIARYGESNWTHGMQGGEDWLRYGRAWGWGRYVFHLPPGLRRIRMLTDRLKDPHISWSEGADFRVEPDRQRLLFARDPFTEAKAETVLLPNGKTDRLLELWAVHTEWDQRYLQEQWGSLAQRDRPSSEGYARSLRSWWKLAVLGVSSRHLQCHLADILDLPYTVQDGEQLIEVFPERGYQVFVTTERRYLAHAQAEVAVPFQVPLPAGTLLTRGLEWFDLHRGEAPPIPVLYVMPEWMDLPMRAPIGFPNRLVPIVVEMGPFTKVSWELYGPDAEKLWEELHVRGMARGQTIAHLLDFRPQPFGEPEPYHLPSQINPMEFLVRHILRQAIVARVHWHRRGIQAQPARDFSSSIQMVPPHTMIIVVLELTNPPETVTMSHDGDTMHSWDGMSPMHETWLHSGVFDSSRALSID